MPRSPDAELEDRIVAAAMRLLDRGGESAITLRAVAKEAGTTSPTIYQRFRDRDGLMNRVVKEGVNQALAVLRPKTSVEGMFGEYLRFNCTFTMRFNLTVETFGTRLASGDKMPAYDLLKARISHQLGISGRRCEDLALAVTSLAFGTARGMIAAGSDTKHAEDLRKASLGALRLLLAAFSEPQTVRKPIGRRITQRRRAD